MVIKRKYLFLFVYAMTLICLLLSTADFVPMVGLLAKTKYIYILFCIFDLIYHRGNYRNFDFLVGSVFLVYSVYCFLYGVIFTNPTVAEETHYQLKTTILMLLLLFLTYYEMEYYCCFQEFVMISYCAMSFVLLACYFTHIGESSFNPFYIFKILFNGDARSRSTFGLGHWNYVGFLCFVDLLFSILLLNELKENWRLRTNFKKLVIILSIDLIVYLQLVSASTRSAILSLCVFFLCYVLLLFFQKLSIQNRFLIGFFFLILFCLVVFVSYQTGLITKIWESREMNININMPIFHQYGNFWTGMGWVENGALQPGVDAFGLGTSSLDVFYVYVYFTTGFIGCVLMGIVYLMMGFGICKRHSYTNFAVYFSLFVSLVFMMLFETVLFTIKFWSGIPLLMLVFHGMSIRENRKNYKH